MIRKIKAERNNSFFCCVDTVYRLLDQDCSPHTYMQLRKALTRYFSASSFMRGKSGKAAKESADLSTQSSDRDSTVPKLFMIPSKGKDDSPRTQYESHISTLWKLRDQVSLSLSLFALRTHKHASIAHNFELLLHQYSLMFLGHTSLIVNLKFNVLVKALVVFKFEVVGFCYRCCR